MEKNLKKTTECVDNWLNHGAIDRSRPMKIVQVVQSYYPAIVYGGPIYSIHYVCRELARMGLEIEVATTNANGNSKLDVETGSPVLFDKNYSVCYYDDTIISRFSLSFTLHLWRHLKNADVVHLQDVFSTYAAWTLVLGGVSRKPILISARGTFTTWGLKSKRPWLKKLWLALFVHPFVGNTKRVAWHATSYQERDEILAVAPKARVYVIPNGIDCSAYAHFTSPSRSEYFSRFIPGSAIEPQKAKVLVALGRLHIKKAFDVVIRALSLLVDDIPDLILLIAGGDDGEQDFLLELVKELGLQGRVALVGEVKNEDKIRFLKGADIFLFPSHNENFGNVVLEALAAGLSVVASKNTPWRELEEAGTGLWVENTPQAFAKAIVELLSRDPVAADMKAKEHVSRYDLQTVAAAFKQTYSELINGR